MKTEKVTAIVEYAAIIEMATAEYDAALAAALAAAQAKYEATVRDARRAAAHESVIESFDE